MLNTADQTWRATLERLKNKFEEAADEFPEVGRLILRPLDDTTGVPPSWETRFAQAGGFSESVCSAPWLSFERISYLCGTAIGRSRFEQLAKQAYHALPGTRDGKAQKYPQADHRERWLAFVDEQLRKHHPSCIETDGHFLFCYRDSNKELREELLEPEIVEMSVPEFLNSEGYDDLSPEAYANPDHRYLQAVCPSVDHLGASVQKWRYWEWSLDPFTCSVIAIEALLNVPDSQVTYWVSFQEAERANIWSLEDNNFLVDEIPLGEGGRFPFFRDWCKPIEGNVPSICPNAEPPDNDKDKEALELWLPHIERRYRELGLLAESETIFWVGRQSTLGSCCHCDLTYPQGKEKTENATSANQTADQCNQPEATPVVILQTPSKIPTVFGKRKKKLTQAQYNVVKTLLNAGDQGLTKDQLIDMSRHGDALGVLQRLKQSDPDWNQVISFPGVAGGGYRIISEPAK